MCLRNIWVTLSDKMANDFEEEFVADVSEGDEFLFIYLFIFIFYLFFLFYFIYFFNLNLFFLGDEDKVINTAIVPLKLAYGIEAKGH